MARLVGRVLVDVGGYEGGRDQVILIYLAEERLGNLSLGQMERMRVLGNQIVEAVLVVVGLG